MLSGKEVSEDDEVQQKLPTRGRSIQSVLNEMRSSQADEPVVEAPVVTDDFTPKPSDPNAAKLPPEELDLFNYERTAAA